MFSKEVIAVVLQVIKNWQVLAITVALVAYMFLVNYVARTYHRPSFVSKSRPKKTKTKAIPRLKIKSKGKGKGKEVSEDVDPNGALGIEEGQ